MMAKVGSIPERGFESDLARGACSPRHSRTVTCSEAIPGRDGTKFWFRGEKRKKI